ncbi:unnamed protein product, partial [Meganyctiphanes norvegica]
GGPSQFPWGGTRTSPEDYFPPDPSAPGDKMTTNGTGVILNHTAPPPQDTSLKQAKANKASNSRWSLFPSNTKDSKMDSLVQQLDLYSKQGIPQQPVYQNLLHTHS